MCIRDRCAAAPSKETNEFGSGPPADSSSFLLTRSACLMGIRASMYSSWSNVTAPSALRYRDVGAVQ
eukprot:2375921-Pyramimonas_sp.AAC.1